MIQNKTGQDRTVEGNLTGEDIQMGVSDIGHIMAVLTDLYSDREAACIREYSTNARDAHVEAGVNAPIEVTTPTHLAPFFTVRDFGIGLSLEDIRVIYSQYGASTKRGTNTQTGMLGLGCKSALTYADQFTVTSVKDGVRIQVVVSRKAMGAAMKVVDTSDTDEPNGTTVIIPAKAHNTFEYKAKDFFQYWAKGSVKLNGREPEYVPNAKWVSDDIAIIDGRQNFVVMGGVPYPAPNLRDGLGYGQSIVAFVPIGSIDFAPSREALMDTDTTTATLRKVEQDFQAQLRAAIQKDIDAATSHQDAVQRRLDWYAKAPSNVVPANLTYKGKTVPANQDVPDGTIIAPRNGRKMTSHSTMKSGIHMETVLKALWVVGYDHASFTATTKKKLLKYCEDAGIMPDHFILSVGAPDKTWIGDLPFVDWAADIKPIKLPKNARNPTTGRIPGSYDIYEDGDYNEGVPGDDIDASAPVFWMLGRSYEGKVIANFLKDSYPGCTLVMLRTGREAKFQRNFPKAKEATAVVREAFKKYVASMPTDTKIAMAVQDDYSLRLVDKLDASKIDDPAVKHAITLRSRDTKATRAKLDEWRRLGCYWDNDAQSVSNPFHKYMLLPDRYSWSGIDKDHVYRYMNAEFLFQTVKVAKVAS